MAQSDLQHFSALLQASHIPDKLVGGPTDAARYVLYFIREVDNRFSEIVDRVKKGAPALPWIDYDPYQTLGCFLLDADSSKDESPLGWAAYQLIKLHQQRAELVMCLAGILRLSLKETIQAWKVRKGIRRGRRPRILGNKGHKIALRVREQLPTFEKAFSDMQRLKRQSGRSWRRIQGRLLTLGHSEEIINGLRGFRSPLSAACNLVADRADPKLELQTVQNYYSKYRKIFPKLVLKNVPGLAKPAIMFDPA